MTAPKNPTSRAKNIQIPGDTAAPTEPAGPDNGSATDTGPGAPDDDQQEVIAVQGDTNLEPADNPEAGTDVAAVALAAENKELRERIAALEAQAAQPVAAVALENPRRDQAPARTEVASRNRRDFAHMRAADIDVSKLTGSVQTKDGWLVPPALTKAGPK